MRVVVALMRSSGMKLTKDEVFAFDEASVKGRRERLAPAIGPP